jgi:hypothetical protein
MDKEVKYQGVWWLPDQPKNRVCGAFTFTPTTGVVLELEGELHPNIPIQIGSFNPSLIVGIANSGEYINIINCRSTGVSHRRDTYSTSKFAGEMAFTGKHKNAIHFSNTEQILFRRLSIHYANLDEWLAEYIADFNVEEADFSQGRPVTIEYMPTRAFEVECDGYKIILSIRHDRKHSPRKRITIGKQAFIEIAFEESKSLDDCFYYIYQLRNFLTLGLSVPTYPLQVSGRLETEENLDFLYSLPHLPTEIKPINPDHILFTFPNIQDNFQSYLDSWFKQAEPLKPVYDLYFSTRYNPHEYLQSTFLSLTQALETYHRRQYGGVYLATEAYKQDVYPKLAEAIPPDLGNDFKQSLKNGTLKYANQFSLRKRLKDMTKELSEQRLGIIFLNTKDKRYSFADRVNNVRNYLTHYDPNSPVDISSQELLDLIEKLRAILEIYLLKEIGFEFSQIREMTREHWKYKPVFRRW